MQCLNSYYTIFALFFLIHCHTFFPLYQYSYTKSNLKKKKKFKLKFIWHPKALIVKLKQFLNYFFFFWIIKTIPKLNTYKTKQRIKQITSKLFYIYIYIYNYYIKSRIRLDVIISHYYFELRYFFSLLF